MRIGAFRRGVARAFCQKSTPSSKITCFAYFSRAWLSAPTKGRLRDALLSKCPRFFINISKEAHGAMRTVGFLIFRRRFTNDFFVVQVQWGEDRRRSPIDFLSWLRMKSTCRSHHRKSSEDHPFWCRMIWDTFDRVREYWNPPKAPWDRSCCSRQEQWFVQGRDTPWYTPFWVPLNLWDKNTIFASTN